MLRVASFNLKDLFDPVSDEEREIMRAKLSHVADRVLRARPDVLALQEVASDALVEQLRTGPLAELGFGSPVLGPRDRRGIGVGILSRFPISSSTLHRAEELDFPRFVDTDAAPFQGRLPARRGVVELTVDAGALGAVTVMTLHFKSKLGTPMKRADGSTVEDPSMAGRAAAALRALVARSAEALHLRRIVDAKLAAPELKLCVLGDFNDTLGSVPIEIVRGLGAPAEQALEAALSVVPAERRYSVLHRGERELIDHILCSSALAARLVDAGIENQELRDHGPHDPNGPPQPDSDHALVWASFA